MTCLAAKDERESRKEQEKEKENENEKENETENACTYCPLFLQGSGGGEEGLGR